MHGLLVVCSSILVNGHCTLVFGNIFHSVMLDESLITVFPEPIPLTVQEMRSTTTRISFKLNIKVCESLDLTDLVFHDLRTTFCSPDSRCSPELYFNSSVFEIPDLLPSTCYHFSFKARLRWLSEPWEQTGVHCTGESHSGILEG